MKMSNENQRLVSELCRQFHSRGQAVVPGTGVAIKEGEQVFIPPGEVHLDRLEQEDVFTFNVEFDSDGNPDLNKEATSPCHNISAYTHLFLRIFQEFDCGCVIYAQPTSAVVVAEMFESHFKIKNNQLISQISNGETKEQYPWTHELAVPIVNNPDDQTKLFKRLENAFTKNPATNAVLVKGNGLVVCGDTWQETKLMFETLLQLFNVAIELRKVTATARQGPSNGVTKPAGKRVQAPISGDDEVAVVHETKPAVRKAAAAPEKPSVARKAPRPAKLPAKLPTDLRTRIVDSDPFKAEALKRKKLALARLRDRTSGSGPLAGGRRNAASFMNNDMMMNQTMNQPMNQPINNLNNMNNMNMMMGNTMMDMMAMNTQPNMNMMMMDQGAMGMFNMGGGGGNMNMGNMDMASGGSGPGMDNGMFRAMTRGRGSSRGRPVRGRGVSRGRGRPFPARRSPFKGSVKERLGFKSDITVDPSLLNENTVNEEDY